MDFIVENNLEMTIQYREDGRGSVVVEFGDG